MPTPPLATDERCAAHPARPAVDACPVCQRPRCGADAVLTGCLLCLTTPQTQPVRRPAGQLERLVRAALAAYVAALALGKVASEYVQSPTLQYLAPALLGVLAGGAALAAAGSPGRGVLLQRVRVVAVLYALGGAALGSVDEEDYRHGVLDLLPGALLPMLIAVAAAWLWTAPPRARKRPAS